jgi:hypothetical protein
MIETYAYQTWIEQVERIERDLDDGDESMFEAGLENLHGCIADAALGRRVPLVWMETVGALEIDRRGRQRLFRMRHHDDHECGAYGLLFDDGHNRWVPPWIGTCAEAEVWLARPWPPLAVKAPTLDVDGVRGLAAELAKLSPEDRANWVEPFTADEQVHLWAFHQRLRASITDIEPIDRARVETAIERIYASVGLPRPVMIRADGPTQALMIVAALDNAAPADPKLAAALAPMIAWLDWFCWTHCWRAARRLDDARLEAMWKWPSRFSEERSRWMARLEDRLATHDTGVFLGALVSRHVRAAVDRWWPLAATEVRRWLPPTGRALTCADLHCRGPRARLEEMPQALCLRAIKGQSVGTLGKELRDVLVNDQFIVPALQARALGVRYPRIHDELLDEWLVLADAGWTVRRHGLAIYCERPRHINADVGIEFGDGVVVTL